MFENLSVVMLTVTGFVVTFLSLEAAWHFTACKIKDKSIKPCLFKQMGLLN